MHRLIMRSDTYRRASRSAEGENARKDPDNVFLWRMNRKRLEGEILWDAMHAAAGTLNLKMGGRPVIPSLGDEELAALRDRWQWVVSADPKEPNRRGVYILVRRNYRFPMFEAFDAPVNSVSCPCRDVTTVAPQALWFLNNQTAFRQAQAFAARLSRESGQEPARQIDRAWQIAVGRLPSDREREESLQLLKSLGSGPEALAKLCLALFNLNEFAFVD